MRTASGAARGRTGRLGSNRAIEPVRRAAAVERATVAIERGRFTLAEKIIEAALEHAAPHDKLRLLQKLAMLLEIEGRTDDMRARPARELAIHRCALASDPQTLAARAGQAAASDPARITWKKASRTTLASGSGAVCLPVGPARSTRPPSGSMSA